MRVWSISLHGSVWSAQGDHQGFMQEGDKIPWIMYSSTIWGSSFYDEERCHSWMHILESTIEDTPLSVHSAARKCIMAISWVIHIVWWLMKDFGDLVQWCVECVGEWNVATGVEGMSWEMPLLFFPISSCPNLEWHSKMDRPQLVTNLFKNRRRRRGLNVSWAWESAKYEKRPPVDMQMLQILWLHLLD